MAFLLVVGCASTGYDAKSEKHPKSTTPPTPLPSPYALAQKCGELEAVLEEDRKLVPQTYSMTCPTLRPFKWQQVAPWAVARAARLGVLLESEKFYAAPEQVAEANRFGLLFFFPAGITDLAILESAEPSALIRVNAADHLAPGELLSLRQKVRISREDRAYNECRALLLDVAESAQHPQRAEACVSTMASIDRARTVRETARLQQELERTQQEQLRRAQRLREEMDLRQQAIAAEQQEEEQRERRAAILRGIAAGLTVYGQRPQSAPTARPFPNGPSALRASPGPVQQTQPNARSCSSDFDCGIGNVCVKPNFATSGECMAAVNGYGLPQYKPPRADSILPKFPKRTDCRFVTDCPPGFTCDTESGACVK